MVRTWHGAIALVFLLSMVGSVNGRKYSHQEPSHSQPLVQIGAMVVGLNAVTILSAYGRELDELVVHDQQVHAQHGVTKIMFATMTPLVTIKLK
jgi:hypothetical protein